MRGYVVLAAFLAGACGGSAGQGEAFGRSDALHFPDPAATEVKPDMSDALETQVLDTAMDIEATKPIDLPHAEPQEELPSPTDLGTDQPDFGPELSPDLPTDLDSGLPQGCSPRAMQVYVVADDNSFSRFRPELKSFELVGWLNCNNPLATPFSMAIDRNATAWVLYNDGSLYEVSTEDASCKPTKFKPNQAGFDLFGMGFAADAPSSQMETLYVSKYVDSFTSSTSTLGRISFPDLVLTPIAPLPSGAGSAELTGTGLGELWGFFPGASKALVVQLDKETGQALKTFPLPANVVQNVHAWAFAFWGGGFYLFFATFADSHSKVYRLDPSTGDLVLVIEDAGHVITGAGVSSCAPTKQP